MSELNGNYCLKHGGTGTAPECRSSAGKNTRPLLNMYFSET